MHPSSLLQLFAALPPPPPLSPFLPPSIAPPSPLLPSLLPSSSSSPPLPSSPFDPLAASFRPSIAVIIGVLTTMFSLTFLLLLYAKHCKRNGIGVYDRSDLSIVATSPPVPPPLLRGRNSGVDRSIIDVLPTFSFASLHGLKDGLECAVCLSRFDIPDILRLLPKCKHAFHLECVDTWLSSHSTCPLCRNRVEADDVLIADDLVAGGKCSADEQQPARNSGAGRSSSAGRNSNVEAAGIDRAFQVYVQREMENMGSQPSPDALGRARNPSRKESICRSSSWKSKHGDGQRDSLLQAMDLDEHEVAKRFGHRIIISDALSQHRWSDFEGSALFLSSQTLFARLRGTENNVGDHSIRTDMVSAGNGSTTDMFGRPSTSSSFINSPSVRLDATSPPCKDIDGIALPQAPHRSLSGRSNVLPQLSKSRIQDVFLSRLSASRNSSKAESGLLHSASERDIEVAIDFSKEARGEAKAGVFERQASFLRRAFATGRPDSGSSLQMPSYQRSVSEVSGIRRYAESGKSNSNGDEEQWLSIARKTLTWIMGGGKGRPFHQMDGPHG